jgi:ABC-type multidrug transport system permease subunit
MATRTPSVTRLPAGQPAPVPVRRMSGTLGTVLTALMSLLTILVFGLALDQRDPVWLWVAFVSALIAGFFVQVLIAGRHNKDADRSS